MSQADDIRRFVISSYIEPARSRDEQRVSVRAGDVHRAMGLSNAMPAVCSAIGSSKFLVDANVTEAGRDGPPNSSTVRFTFDLNKTGAFDVGAAEAKLRARYGGPDVDADKLVSFSLTDGRAIALQRDIPKVQLWLEDNGQPAPVTEQKLYEPSELRHSNLPGRLKHEPSNAFREQGFPKAVRSVRAANHAELISILDWYERGGGRAGAVVDKSSEIRDEENKVPEITATNLILYGPPGTGKTYASAREAVMLCDGRLPDDPGRGALMSRFNTLKEAGRIAFVTFHQSYAYEDFVEGLRPETNIDGEGDQQASGGFRLKPTDGIFKRISAVAEQAGQAAPANLNLSTRSFFKMSLGAVDEEEEVYRAAIDGGYIALGWGTEFDWSEPVYEDFDAILDRWRSDDPNLNSLSSRVKQSHYMRAVMKEGDIVVISYGNSQFRAVGEVVGPYEYEPDASQYRHRRKVRWLRVFDRPLPVETILKGKFTQAALYKLDKGKLNLAAMETLIGEGQQRKSAPDGMALPYVLIIDEINRANISKVFGELITLIEPDKRLGCLNAMSVTLPYSGEDFGVPANLHIIGTMNTADRSIALLDTALRRRFQFKELMPDASLLTAKAGQIDVSSVLKRLNERIEYLFDREHQIGHAYFMGCDTRGKLDDVMRTKVIPLLTEYFYDDWEKVRQVLGESGDNGSFVVRTKLQPPAASLEEVGAERYRYTIRPVFAESAYDHLTQ
jgi:5-methylcytosine-specific restriction enzyme B